MNELITMSLKLADVTKLIDFPKELLSVNETSVVDWLLEYNIAYSSSPKLKRLVAEFPHFVPVKISDDDELPLDDIYDQTLKRKLRDYSSRTLDNALIEMSTGEELPVDMLRNLLVTINSASGLTHYSKFDRDLYFRPKGMPLGLKLIDNATGGIAKGDFALLAGRLGVGKSTLAQWIAYNWWQDGKQVLYVSNEMLPMDIFSRLDAMVGHFNPLRFRTCTRDDMWGDMETVIAKVSEHDNEIIVPRKRLSTPGEVFSLAQFLDIDVVIIDGLYLMRPDGPALSSKWERVATVSNQTKQMALDLMMPVVGVVQIKRVGDKAVFDPEDLAYSDALGQDADFVMALRPDNVHMDRIEVQLIKNRYGPNMATLIRVNFENMQIVDESMVGAVDTLPPREGALW